MFEHTFRSRLAARVALGVSLAAGALICSADEPQRDVDGLVRVHDQGVDHLYVLPEADFANYSKVHLDPVDVSFSERWNPNSTRSAASRRLSDQDIKELKSNVASEFERIVARELMMGGYMLVEEDGEGVLRVTPMIVNLYITQPSQATRGSARVYIANTGHMTLAAIARDSVTGEILARVVDTQQGRRTGRLEIASSTSNMADARSAFTRWAGVLRTGLDDARKYPTSASAPQKEASEVSSGAPR
jgi:Protein of unknown function (DUF3313)